MSERKIKIEQHGGLGVLWMIGWLFSIGFLQQSFFKGLIAIILWPYFLGVHVSGIVETPEPRIEVQVD